MAKCRVVRYGTYEVSTKPKKRIPFFFQSEKAEFDIFIRVASEVKGYNVSGKPKKGLSRFFPSGKPKLEIFTEPIAEVKDTVIPLYHYWEGAFRNLSIGLHGVGGRLGKAPFPVTSYLDKTGTNDLRIIHGDNKFDVLYTFTVHSKSAVMLTLVVTFIGALIGSLIIALIFRFI